MFSIEVKTHGLLDVAVPPNIKIDVASLSNNMIGGPEQATITATAPRDGLYPLLNWLNYQIKIFGAGQLWTGFVDEVSLALGGVEVGLSLENMYNRVRVAYTYDSPSGEQTRGNTDWAEDSGSIARYGVRELQHSVSDQSLTQAEALRDQLLAKFKNPQKKIRITGSGTAAQATINCRGYNTKLGWEYYENLVGIEEYNEGGSSEILVGWALTSNQIAFDSISNKIHDYQARLELLQNGDRLAVTGSTSNNATYQVTAETEDDAQRTYTASTISLDPTDDILDSANGLEDNLTSKQLINLSGTSGHDGWYVIKSIQEPDHITVNPATLTAEAAGSSITITHGNSVEVDTTPVLEFPSSTATLTSEGYKVAQSFQITTGWDADKISIRVYKVGSPSDNLTVTVHSDNSGVPGSILGTATILNADIPTAMNWAEASFVSRFALSAATTYWIQVARSGSASESNAFRVEINDSEDREGYASGIVKAWNGSSWATRDADMPFRLLSAVETTEQIEAMLTASSHVSTADIQLASGIYTNQYREGDRTILDEINELLAVGGSSGETMISTLNENGVYSVLEKPASSTVQWAIANDGTLRNMADVALAEGRLIAGQWLELLDLPGYPSLSPFFVERCEYSNGAYSIDPEGVKSPFDFDVEQG